MKKRGFLSSSRQYSGILSDNESTFDDFFEPDCADPKINKMLTQLLYISHYLQSVKEQVSYEDYADDLISLIRKGNDGLISAAQALKEADYLLNE